MIQMTAPSPTTIRAGGTVRSRHEASAACPPSQSQRCGSPAPTIRRIPRQGQLGTRVTVKSVALIACGESLFGGSCRPEIARICRVFAEYCAPRSSGAVPGPDSRYCVMVVAESSVSKYLGSPPPDPPAKLTSRPQPRRSPMAAVGATLELVGGAEITATLRATVAAGIALVGLGVLSDVHPPSTRMAASNPGLSSTRRCTPGFPGVRAKIVEALVDSDGDL
jgi:hypothetical protein